MHRSGTSAIAGLAIRLGASGPHTPMPADANNPHGYWESAALYEFHERLLAAAASRWDDWTAIRRDWLDSSAATALGAEAVQLLESEFGAASLIAFKDPRACRLVPFWRRVFETAHVEMAPVLVMRHPFEVAESLALRDGFRRERSILLWLRHVLEAEFETRNIPRSFVRYSDALTDWRTASARLHLSGPRPTTPLDASIDRFLSRELRHHVAGTTRWEVPAPLSDWAHQAWAVLDEAGATGVLPANGVDVLDGVHQELDRAAARFGHLPEDDRPALRSRLVRLEAELRTAQELKTDLAASVAERDRLVHHAAGLEATRAALDQAVQQLNQRLLDLERRHDRFTAKRQEEHRRLVAEIQERHDRVMADLTAAQTERVQLQEQLSALDEQLGVATSRIQSLLDSASWRVTAPLRAAARLIKPDR